MTDEGDGLMRDAGVEAFPVSCRDFPLGRGEEDSAENFLSPVAGSRRGLAVEEALCLFPEACPVSLPEVRKGARQSGGRSGVENGDDDREMIGVEASLRRPGERWKELRGD